MDDYGSYYPESYSYRGYGPDFTQAPSARLDYPFDWVLNLENDEIADSEFVNPDGLTLEEESVIGTRTNVVVSGVVLGRTHRLTNRVTFASGLSDEQTIRILGRDS